MIAGAPTKPGTEAKFRDALDRVCRQRDCYASRLYWYTDLEQAKQVAKSSGKPILSLHLLGNLDEDLSCANSRFFRTTLYSDPKISGYMRDHFVLHWQSVRPAPKITVDFGDGHRLLRTITGNSIHYMLDDDGRPLEALPGDRSGMEEDRGKVRRESPLRSGVRRSDPAEDLESRRTRGHAP